MNRKQPFRMILIIPALMLILGHPSFRAQPYDTDLCITHYDVCVIPDFDNNNVEIMVKAKIKNFSPKTMDTDEIMVGKSGNHDDWDIEMKEICWVENGRKSDLSFTLKTVQHPYYDMTIPLYKISFKKSLKPDEEATVEFLYTIFGKKKETGFPLQRAAEKELYLITDFAWLPDFFVLGKPNQFPRKYSPSWTLTVEYPSTYVAVVDGEMVNRKRKEGKVVENWRSIISQWPQILIGDYDVIKNTKGDFTLEIYCLKSEEDREAVLSAVDDAIRTFELYDSLFGSPGSRFFRLVGSYTDWGGHGLAFGTVLQRSMLERLHVIAHEMAHTWWGGSVQSYGEGSKFLREAMAEFSADWAIKTIKGEEEFHRMMVHRKRATFCGLPTRKAPADQVPLIEQEGYDSGRIVSANYSKGSLALNQVRFEVGDELFFKGLKTFAESYKGKNAGIHDFVRTFNQVTDKDLTGLFQNLLWSADYPSYKLEGFRSKKVDRGYQATVKIRNEGGYGLSCPLLLKSEKDFAKKIFFVEGHSENDFTYKTQNEVKEVVIDPDLTAYQYHPDQRDKLAQEIPEYDESYLEKNRGVNWAWFFTSYSHFLKGDYEKAIKILSRYFQYDMERLEIENLQEALSEETSRTHRLIMAPYIMTRGLYYLALDDLDHSEADIKMVIPVILDSLLLDRYSVEFSAWANTGLLFKNEHRELIAILVQITRKNFEWDEMWSMKEKEHKVDQWREWWDREGKHQRLKLEPLKTKYNIER